VISLGLGLALNILGRRDGPVGTATEQRAKRSGVQIPAGASKTFRSALRALSSGYRGPIPGVKWTGRDTDRLHSSSAQVKNEWSYTSIPPNCHHGVDRDSVAFIMF
jgi:hypothetical protein